MKIRKVIKIALVMADNVVPPIVAPGPDENVPGKVAGNTPENDTLGNLPEENSDFGNLFESLNLDAIESWTEQQQQSVRDPLMEYQHLFATNLSELGKTSLVQHDIKLDDPTPFKEHY